MDEKTTKSITFSPNPGKQMEFLSAREDRILYGGARGGGKSLALAWKAALTPHKWHWSYGGKQIPIAEYRRMSGAQKNKCVFVVDKVSVDYPEFRGILIRRTHPQLEQNLRPECDKLYKPMGAKWQERHHRYLFPSNATISLRHCKDRKALDDFVGGNYHFIGIDEANLFIKSWVDEIESSLRSTLKEVKAQLCLTANPGKQGHKWLKENYVDTCPPIFNGPRLYNETFDVEYQPTKSGKPFKDAQGLTRRYIPATIFDNPYILNNDPGYVLKLKGLSPTLRAMWLEGRWDVFQGMFFDRWDEGIHTIDQPDFRYGKHFSVETHKLYRAFDYGTKAPFVCLFIAVDKDGYAIVFDEIVETGLSASRQAELVRDHTFQKYELKSSDFVEDVADPAYWTKSGEKEGELYSPADRYEDEGIYLVRGAHDRKAMAKIVYDALDIPNPRIRFTSNCEYCISTIPVLVSDANDPEKVDTGGEDHAFDTIGYFAMRILTGFIEKQKQRNSESWRDRLNKANTPFGVGWKVI